MEEKRKVFIRGVEDRGNEVITTLTNLGAKNDVAEGNNSNCIYFIGHDGYINCIEIGSEFAKIIEDTYKEIKLWKDGDILFSENNNEFAVFAKWPTDPDKFFSYITIWPWHQYYVTYQVIDKKDFRIATKEEIAQFYERLHSNGKDWDAEKKKLVDWKRKPAVGDRCWMVTSNGKVNMFLWFGDKTNMKLLDFGNCFHTKEDAKIAAKKIKHLLKEE